MSRLAHNVLVTLAASFVALLAAGGVQEGFSALWPEFSDRFVGLTSIGSYVGLATSALIFFAVGYFVPPWLKSQGLAWLEWPIVALYVVFIATGPEYYCCTGRGVGFYLSFHLMFIVPLLACALGYKARRLGRRTYSESSMSQTAPAFAASQPILRDQGNPASPRSQPP